MFEPNISIDISLLAIILGLYATKKDKNLVLMFICCLFVHVLLTRDAEDQAKGVEDGVEDGVDGDGDVDGDVDVKDDVRDDVRDDLGNDLGVVPATDFTVAENQVSRPFPFKASDIFKTTVSSGVFERQLSTPQTKLTSTVFPASSAEANGRLASARDSFFKSLVS